MSHANEHMDYVTCLGRNFPNIQVACFGDPWVYANIVWEAGDPLPTQEELDAHCVMTSKEDKIAALSNLCQQQIIGGFVSNALGVPHFYDSEEVDQLNLIGATVTISPTPTDLDGGGIPYATRPIIDGVTQPKTYAFHTYDQLRQVMQDGAMFKLACLQNFNDKRDWLNNNAMTIEDIMSMTWSSNP